jgi:hypothetical protein
MARHAKRRFLSAALIVLVMLGASASVPERAGAQDRQAATCPIPASDVDMGVAVCVDRGAGAVYAEGDRITICVTANIPQILIFPPPPPPTIRLVDIVNGVEQGEIFREDFVSGERCVERVIGPPFGQETIRAEALGDDGRVFAMSAVGFRTVPAQLQPSPSPPSSARYIEAALDLSAPCIPAGGDDVCAAGRRALWNGDAGAWAARGVTDPDEVFVQTVILRVRAGDPAAIANLARILGSPYLKVTMLRFAQDELVEVTNLGGGAQDLTGWSVRSPATGDAVALPAGVLLQPGERCFVHTGPTRASPSDRCYVITPARPDLLEGLWPDDAGAIVLFAGPLGLIADETRYSADVNDQPPPPNLQGTTRVVVGPPAGGR